MDKLGLQIGIIQWGRRLLEYYQITLSDQKVTCLKVTHFSNFPETLKNTQQIFGSIFVVHRLRLFQKSVC